MWPAVMVLSFGGTLMQRCESPAHFAGIYHIEEELNVANYNKETGKFVEGRDKAKEEWDIAFVEDGKGWDQWIFSCLGVGGPLGYNVTRHVTRLRDGERRVSTRFGLCTEMPWSSILRCVWNGTHARSEYVPTQVTSDCEVLEMVEVSHRWPHFLPSASLVPSHTTRTHSTPPPPLSLLSTISLKITSRWQRIGISVLIPRTCACVRL